jgi:hypothetical protein
MLSNFSILGQGYVIRGHDESLRGARAAAAQWMREQGRSNFEAEQATEQAPVQQSWWNDELKAFVQPDHEGAEPVTVVNIPV